MGYELWGRTYGALGYGQKQKETHLQSDPRKKILELQLVFLLLFKTLLDPIG